MLNKKWNNGEIVFLKKNYYKMTYKEIGIVLGRTVKSVSRKIENIGLKKKINKKWTENMK